MFSSNFKQKCSKLQSILTEIQRLCPVVPLGVPHGALEDFELENGKWKIPKGCMIMVNHWSINHSAKYFENPMEFKPLRFVSNNAFRKSPYMMPFQVYEFRKKSSRDDAIFIML